MEESKAFVLSSDDLLCPSTLFLPRTGVIELFGQEFHVSPEMCLFLSIDIYRHFMRSDDHYVIGPNNMPKLLRAPSQDGVKTLHALFSQLLCLLSGHSKIIVDKSNEIQMKYIARCLRNYSLLQELRTSTELTLKSSFSSLMDEDQSERDFTFYIGKREFACSQMLAAYLSPAAAKRCLIGENSMSIRPLKHISFDSALDSVFGLLYGETLHINKANRCSIIYIATQIENANLLSQALEVPDLNIDCCIHDMISSTNGISDEMALIMSRPFIGFVSENFFKLPASDIARLNPSIIELILQSDRLKVGSEDELLQIIEEVIRLNGIQALNLLSYVHFESLSSGSVKRFLETFSFDDITCNTFTAISRRLQCEVFESYEQNERWQNQTLNSTRLEYEKKKGELAKLETQIDTLSSSIEKMRPLPQLFIVETCMDSHNVWDLADFLTNNDTPIKSCWEHGHWNQLFWYDGEYIRPLGSDKVVTIGDDYDGCIIIKDNEWKESQKWTLSDDGRIISRDGRCITIGDRTVRALFPSLSPQGDLLFARPKEDTPAQMFTFKFKEDPTKIYNFVL